MINVNKLTKRYARTTAVDEISFDVEKGRIVGFLGPNGAGKTTTMRMLTCFLPPTAGAATVAGFDVLEQSFEVKKRIGYLPETPPLYPEMRTAEYLQFVGSLKGLAKAELAKRVDYVCERCAILDVKDKLLGKLSKGYRQRVGLAPAASISRTSMTIARPSKSKAAKGSCAAIWPARSSKPVGTSTNFAPPPSASKKFSWSSPENRPRS